MNKNRIRGLRWRASEHGIAKPISIKLTGGKSGGCASKAVEELQRHAQELATKPAQWMPWSYRETLERIVPLSDSA